MIKLRGGRLRQKAEQQCMSLLVGHVNREAADLIPQSLRRLNHLQLAAAAT